MLMGWYDFKRFPGASPLIFNSYHTSPVGFHWPSYDERDLYFLNVGVMRVSDISRYIYDDELKWCTVVDYYGLSYAEGGNSGNG